MNDESVIHETVFDLFEEWLPYHHVCDTAEAVRHLTCVRTSYSIRREIHASMSLHESLYGKILYIHEIAVRHVRQGHATRFIQELMQMRHWQIKLLGPFSVSGRAFAVKMNLM